MLFFGHIGIPIVAARLSQRRKNPSGFALFFQSLDYRAFILGALLPDLIDKPLSIIFSNVIGTTQSLGHSMLFLILLLLIGFIVYTKFNKPFLLSLAIGVLSHRALDIVTMTYKNFLWPLYGFEFIRIEHLKTNLVQNLINHLTSPYYLFGEIIGLPICVYYFTNMCINSRFVDFIRSGKISIK
jgi:membrane-bound metal-dependent hydrolase YbcI (DUF457 family)